MKNDQAVNEIIGSVLIVILVIALAAVVASLFLGFINLTTKPAFIAADIAKTTSSGKEVISVFNRAGDTGYLNAPADSLYPVGIYVNDTTIGSYRIQPPPGVNAFSPGATLLVFYNSSTGYAIAGSPTVPASADPVLPGSLTSVRLVDERSKFLIAKWDNSTGGTPELSVISITPNSGYNNTVSIPITDLIGTGFQAGATVRLSQTSLPDIPATGVTVVSSTKISCIFNLNGVTAGPYNVVVTNSNGQSAMLVNGFTVYPAGPAPTVTSIAPTSGNRGWLVNITRIAGTGFQPGVIVKLVNSTAGPDITATNVVVNPAGTNITCIFDLTLAPAARRNITVTNPDGRIGTRINGFTVNSNAPTITSRTPTSGLQGATVPFTNVRGTNFQIDSTAVYWQGAYSIPLTGAYVGNSTSITGTLVIPPNAPTGAYNITVTNTDGKKVTRVNWFTVNSNAPSISSITPTSGNRGWLVTVTRVAGTRFQPGALVKLVNTTAGPDITATNVVINPAGTNITCIFDLTLAPAARRNITVTNPDGKVGILVNGFTIGSPAPRITRSTPATGVNGTTVTITDLAGTYFQPGATVVYRQGITSIPLTSVNVISPTQITGTLAIPASAPTGAYNVIVSNTDGKTVTRIGTFTVYANPPPTITGITPGGGQRGVAVPVVVTGTNILAGARVRLYNGTTSVYLAPAGTVTPPSQISTTFTVPLPVLPGTMNVRITNTDGQFGTLTGGYTLLP